MSLQNWRILFLLARNLCLTSGLATIVVTGVPSTAHADTKLGTVVVHPSCGSGQVAIYKSGKFSDCENVNTGSGSGAGSGGLPSPTGGGGGGSGYQITPLSAKMNCAIGKYSPVRPKFQVNKKDAWAYTDQNGVLQVFPKQLGSIPAGWFEAWGSTPTNGIGRSYLYNRPSNCQAFCQTFRYVDPYTGNPGQINLPFTVFETDLLVAVHEIAHQNGVSDESKANGVAAEALQNYRSDSSGSACK